MGIEADTGEEPLPLWKTILIGLALITACELVAGLLGVFVSGVAGMVLAVMLGLMVIVLGSTYLGFEMVLAGILAVAGGFGASFFWLEAYEIWSGPVESGLPVSQAPRYARAKVLILERAEHHPELMGRHVIETRTRDGTADRAVYRVYPVVGPGWTREDPVPLWAAGAEGIPSSWRDYRVAIRSPPLYEDDFQAAIQDACGRYGLTSAKGAPAASFAVSLEQARADASFDAWAYLLFLDFLWLLGAPYFRSMGAEERSLPASR